MAVDVNLDGGVHANDSESADNLGVVRDGLGTKEKLVKVAVPVAVEALESVWGEADRGGGGVIEDTGIEKVQEGILENLGPDGKVLEFIALGQTSNDGVGNVADSRLEREQRRRETLGGDLTLKELNQVLGNGGGGCVLRSVITGDIGETGLDDGNNAIRVDGEVGDSNAILGPHDQVRLAVGRGVAHDDIMEALHAGSEGVDLNDDLLGRLDNLGRGTDRGTGHDTTILSDGGGLNDGNIELAIGAVLGVVSGKEISGEHRQVLVEEVNPSLVDSLGDGLSDLVRGAAVNHVELGPPVLGLGAGRGTDKERVLGRSLEVVLLDMVGEGNREDLGVSDT